MSNSPKSSTIQKTIRFEIEDAERLDQIAKKENSDFADQTRKAVRDYIELYERGNLANIQNNAESLKSKPIWQLTHDEIKSLPLDEIKRIKSIYEVRQIDLKNKSILAKMGKLAKIKYKIRPKFTCLFCDDSCFDEVEIRKHMQKDHPNQTVEKRVNQFPCFICDLIFDNGFKLKDHIAQAHKDEVFKVKDKYPCIYCPNVFGSIELLKEHMVEAHNDHAIKVIEREKIVEKKVEVVKPIEVEKIREVEKKIYICPFPSCDAMFDEKQKVLNHIFEHKRDLKELEINDLMD